MGRSDKDYQEEIRQHIALETQANIDRGMSPEDAARAARLSFGSVAGTRQELQEGRPTYWLSSLAQDFRYAVRSLIRQPLFTLVAVVTLALGIGANTAIFSVLNAVLLRDLPYKDAGQLYRLRTQKTEAMPTGLVAPRFIEPLYEGHPAVEAAAIGFLNQSPAIGSDGTPSLLVRYAVTSRFFDVFKDPMTLGRGFKKGEPVGSIVISEATWRRMYKADPQILGAAIRVDNAPYTVIGVAAQGFEFPREADAWTAVPSDDDTCPYAIR